MEVCFVTKGTVNSVWQDQLHQLKKESLVVFGYNGLGLVSYKKELKGETEYFQDVTKFSRQLNSVIISGCDTDTYGVFRHSAVIADKGRLLGVTDMAHSVDDSEFVSGGSFRVYNTSIGKIGILIGEDLFFPESSRVLTLCDADFIVSIFRKLDNMMPQIMLRASAFCNGIAMGLISGEYACISDIRGRIIMSGSEDIIKKEILIEKDYHLISSRQRGLYRDFNSGY